MNRENKGIFIWHRKKGDMSETVVEVTEKVVESTVSLFKVIFDLGRDAKGMIEDNRRK